MRATPPRGGIGQVRTRQTDSDLTGAARGEYLRPAEDTS